jgi:hypothetical protein
MRGVRPPFVIRRSRYLNPSMGLQTGDFASPPHDGFALVRCHTGADKFATHNQLTLLTDWLAASLVSNCRKMSLPDERCHIQNDWSGRRESNPLHQLGKLR